MRKTIVAAAALAAVLSLGASADRAAAMTAATPTELGLATADGGVVEKAALVCNRWGCRRVWWGHRGLVGPASPRLRLCRPVLGLGLAPSRVGLARSRVGLARLVSQSRSRRSMNG
jgi:hypothetical protein